jgi:peptidoglycan/xylan/chitin deacetylase (PgdA/CDA1 family)
MSNLKNLALRVGATRPALGLFGVPSERGLSTILFHQFFFGDEPRSKARDRLRRQLDWLGQRYSPIGLGQVGEVLEQGTSTKPPLLVTIDDALLDVLEVAEDFRSAEIPVALFVCTGWTAQATPDDSDSLLARVIAEIEWYDGPDTSLKFHGDRREVVLARTRRAASIDSLLATRDEIGEHLPELAERLAAIQPMRRPSRVCSWQQLTRLKDFGIELGSHSVTHIRMAPASGVRRAFEFKESKRLLEQKFGQCTAFAYPFGEPDVVDSTTSADLSDAGYELAFLTHGEFSDRRTSRLHVPRFALPDRDMPMSEFRARVGGGGIPWQRLKAMLAHLRPH